MLYKHKIWTYLSVMINVGDLAVIYQKIKKNSTPWYKVLLPLYAPLPSKPVTKAINGEPPAAADVLADSLLWDWRISTLKLKFSWFYVEAGAENSLAVSRSIRYLFLLSLIHMRTYCLLKCLNIPSCFSLPVSVIFYLWYGVLRKFSKVTKPFPRFWISENDWWRFKGYFGCRCHPRGGWGKGKDFWSCA